MDKAVSFGLVLYEVATGKQAFPAETAALVHGAILHETPAPARNWNSKLPLKLEEIINKALEKDRELRYQTASEIRVDLASVRSRLVPARRPQWVPLWWPVAVDSEHSATRRRRRRDY